MLYKTFEELKVWNDARILSKHIYSVTKGKSFSKDFGLRDQVQRASVSIMSKISEGFERDTNREFVRFLTYSKGSCGEVRSILYVALDQSYISREEFDFLKSQCITVATQISNFMKYLRKTNK
jgi:four helix bundle protein